MRADGFPAALSGFRYGESGLRQVQRFVVSPRSLKAVFKPGDDSRQLSDRLRESDGVSDYAAVFAHNTLYVPAGFREVKADGFSVGNGGERR